MVSYPDFVVTNFNKHLYYQSIRIRELFPDPVRIKTMGYHEFGWEPKKNYNIELRVEGRDAIVVLQFTGPVVVFDVSDLHELVRQGERKEKTLKTAMVDRGIKVIRAGYKPLA